MKVDYSLMFVTDHRIANDEQFFNILLSTLKGGATIIQLREKKMDTKSFYNRALKVMKLCREFEIPLIINDRIDIALAVNADGVHVGQEDLPVEIVRNILGENKIIGLSISNEKQAEQSNNLEVDYVGLSPIFSTNTKKDKLSKPLGIVGLKELKKISTKPMVCIGGVNTHNTGNIIRNGADGVAVVSCISQADNPEQVTKQLKDIICQAGMKQ